MNELRKKWSIFMIITALICIMTAMITGMVVGNEAVKVRLYLSNLPPGMAHPFGTDWLGRDMLKRTLAGLALSVRIGMMGALLSGFIALCASLIAITSRAADRIITWLIDVFLSLPHLISLILISFVIGGGAKGVIIGVGLTHWPQLARLLRAEVWQLKSADYIQLSRQLGKSRWWIIRKHLIPHAMPQVGIGLILLFPHVILHESAITFIGLGLAQDQAAIGIILAEAMRYLAMGMWWLALFPGLCLLLVVRSFDVLGEHIRRLI